MEKLIKKLKALSEKPRIEPKENNVKRIYWNNDCNEIEPLLSDISLNFEGKTSFIFQKRTLLKSINSSN